MTKIGTNAFCFMGWVVLGSNINMLSWRWAGLGLAIPKRMGTGTLVQNSGLGTWALLALTALSLSACGGAFELKDDCECGFYTLNGEMVHWSDGSRIPMVFASNFPQAARPIVKAAADSYNSIFHRTRLVVNVTNAVAPQFTGGNPQAVQGDGRNGIYWITGEWPWPDDANHSDAMASWKIVGNRIVEGDIFFRASSFPLNSAAFSIAEDQFPNFVFVPSQSTNLIMRSMYVVSLHEMGHVLGRLHSDEPDSIMQPEVGSWLADDPFSPYDLNILEQVYRLVSNL